MKAERDKRVLLETNEFRAKPLLEELAAWIETDDPRLHIQEHLKLTKASGFCDAVLYRRTIVEEHVRREINLRIPGGIAGIIKRYSERYGEPLSKSWPRHFAVDVVRGRGPLAEGNDIFMFLPYASGVATQDPRYRFGFEFINVWEQAYRKIVFPAAELILDAETRESLGAALKTGLAEVIYMASVIHEVGHRVGPFRVSPDSNPLMALPIGNLLFACLGELSTDALAIALVPELDELAAFVTLSRLIFFPRKGYARSRGHNTSTDNDATLAPVLWRIARTIGAITPVIGGKFHIDLTALRAVYREALDFADALGFELLASEPSEQPAIAKDRIRKYIDIDEASGDYLLPDELRGVYDRLKNLPEVAFVPPLPMTCSDKSEK